MATCPTCKGNKTVTCEACDGTGRFYPLPFIGIGSSTCKKCNGSKKKRCTNCNGTGKV